MEYQIPLLAAGLHTVDFVVVLIYLGAVLAAGWYFSRQQKHGEDYFVAGRNMPWFAVGLSLVATLLSTITYLAAPGEMIRYGVTLSIGWLSLPFAFVVVNFLWLPFFMRFRVRPGDTPGQDGNQSTERKLTSIYEYLELRFGLTARWLGLGMFVVILRMGWMAIIVLTASRAVAQITYDSAPGVATNLVPQTWTLIIIASVGILATLYTMLGGIKAVIWTDVAQFVVLFGGAVLTIVFVVVETHTGPLEWWHTVTAEKLDGHKFPPLASWDLSVRNTILFASLMSFFWYVCTYVSDQVALQRYFTTPSLRAAIRSNIVNFVADFFIMILLAMCGMALLTYYLQFPAEIAPQAAPGVTDPRHKDVADQIFPHFIAHGLPVGISGLVIAALFAVAMSSLDSGMNSVSTVLTIDVFRRLRPNLKATSELRIARVLTFAAGLSCTAIALPLVFLPQDYNIIDISARTFNCALGPLAAMFVVGMFLPHVGQRAIVISAIVGLFVAVLIAWWTELVWFIGFTDFSDWERALHQTRRPSTFLVTPLAATTTFLLAAILGALLRQPDLQHVRQFTWRAVVLQKTQS